MKILITGSQGYIARNLSKKLSKKKISCYGIGRGNWKRKDYKKWGYYKNVSGTINTKSLKKLKNIKFNYIIHLAGGISPTASLFKSITKKKDYEKNVTSTLNILNYIIKKNRKIKLVYMSTISVFGNSKLKKLKENDKTLPISTYSKNKILAEKLCFNYYKKFNIDIAIIRGTSIFGPGLNRQIIHDVCEKISKNQNIFFGTGNEERDFLYIDDFCNFLQKLISKSFHGYEIIHVGSGKTTKIKKIIYYINNKMGKNIKPKFNKFGSNINPNSLIPNINKTLNYKWKPKMKLLDGLNVYLNWFKKKNKND